MLDRAEDPWDTGFAPDSKTRVSETRVDSKPVRRVIDGRYVRLPRPFVASMSKTLCSSKTRARPVRLSRRAD